MVLADPLLIQHPSCASPQGEENGGGEHRSCAHSRILRECRCEPGGCQDERPQQESGAILEHAVGWSRQEDRQTGQQARSHQRSRSSRDGRGFGGPGQGQPGGKHEKRHKTQRAPREVVDEHCCADERNRASKPADTTADGGGREPSDRRQEPQDEPREDKPGRWLGEP